MARVRSPRQARSLSSTDRMLEAALTLLARDGVAGVTIAAISRLSGVSNGALYHRFGDRRGLLLAAQDRFLSGLEADWLTASAPIWAQRDPDALLAELVEVYLRVFTEQRQVFRAFLMAKDADADVRARGLATSELGAGFIVAQLGARFGCPPQQAMAAYQLLFGQAIVIVLFEESERPLREQSVPAQAGWLTTAMAAVLRAGDGPG